MLGGIGSIDRKAHIGSIRIQLKLRAAHGPILARRGVGAFVDHQLRAAANRWPSRAVQAQPEHALDLSDARNQVLRDQPLLVGPAVTGVQLHQGPGGVPPLLTSKHDKSRWGICVGSFFAGLSMAMSDASTPTTWKPGCASQIARSPVPQPISNALHGAIGFVVTVRTRSKSGLPMSEGVSLPYVICLAKTIFDARVSLRTSTAVFHCLWFSPCILGASHMNTAVLVK